MYSHDETLKINTLENSEGGQLRSALLLQVYAEQRHLRKVPLPGGP